MIVERRWRRAASLAFGLALLAIGEGSAWAWNAAGHRLAASIAWGTMDEATKTATSELLREHPDFERWSARTKESDTRFGVFLEASTWPDDIRKDKRFYSAGIEPPTETEAGFPDMERRLSWHYVDRPLGDGPRGVSTPGLLDRQLVALARVIGDARARRSERAYALPWLVHLVADAHQPLHTATRYDAEGRSDRGGNGFEVFSPWAAHAPETNLHRYWDDLPGPAWLSGGRLEEVARSLMHEHASPREAGVPAEWIAESWRIAVESAYPIGESGTTLTPEFHSAAVATARRRVTEAGYRLGKWLGLLLGPGRGEARGGVGEN